ncbi:MAG TPA: 4,5-DOPA dioxygenase extradiol [Thermoleophilia bacterium]|nr:4,5-DOPA dioxygenase extradiol [Thermoleophilia bacterium]
MLAVSAHWITHGWFATGDRRPRTIHDFYGFPPALYELEYPAPGSPELAVRVQEMAAGLDVGLSSDWGLDHGTWIVLRHMYPDADIPVVQLSIDWDRPPRRHYDTGLALAALRDEGVLVMGSGNLVHNVRAVDFSGIDAPPYHWALEFDRWVEQALVTRDHEALIGYWSLGRLAEMAHPTPDHYYPLLYVLGTQSEGEDLSFLFTGFQYASASMRCVHFS